MDMQRTSIFNGPALSNSLSMLPVSVTLSFLWSRVVSPASNTQPGGPGGHKFSVRSLPFDLFGIGDPTRSARLPPTLSSRGH